MFCFVKRILHPTARRGSSSAIKNIGGIIQRLTFVASLSCIFLNALSPDAKTLITLFAIHPLSSPSSLFTNPPTPPSRAAKAIKPPRREEEPESAPKPPSVALFICFVVAHTIARHVPDVLGTQQEPAVSDGRGIKESLDIIPISNPPSDEGSLRKPAVTDGRGIEEPLDDVTPPNTHFDEESLRKPVATGERGIEESSDVTTPVCDSTLNESSVDTDERKADKKDNEDIIPNTIEGADTSVTDIHDIEETVALAISYVLATAKNTDDERLITLARRIRAQDTQHVPPEATTRNSTEEVSVEPAGAQTEHEERGDVAESENTIKVNEDTEVKNEVMEAMEIEEVAEMSSDEEVNDEVANEGTMDTSAEHGTGSRELEIDAEETEEMKEKHEVIDDQDDVADECTTADIESDNEPKTESDELDEDVTESREMTTEKSKDVQEVKPKEDASRNAYEDDDDSVWFIIRKGKAVKISSRPIPPPVPASTSSTSEEADSATSPSTVATAPTSVDSVAEVPATNTRSQKEDWFSAEDPLLLDVPPKPQAIPSQRGCIIVPAQNPKRLEEKAERHRKAVEAWNALKEERRAAECAKLEEEERKAREVQEAKAARFANFNTAMGRLDELRKAAKEERQKQEQKEEENKKTIKGIDSAQNRIGNIIDMEKVRAMFDPEILKTSSFSTVVGQERAIPQSEIPPPSSVTQADNISVDNTGTLQQNAADRPGPPRVQPSDGVRHVIEKDASAGKPRTLQQNAGKRPSAWHGAASTIKVVGEAASVVKPSALQQNAADRAGPPRVLPSNWGMRYGTNSVSKTIERRLRRRRNELRRQNEQAALSSNNGDGGSSGESLQRDDA